jgi:predicted RNA methylase
LPDVHDAERIYYIASPWRQLRRALPRREVTEADVFVDIGCGKGRVVLEAAAGYPFRSCMGVELVPEIYQQAVANIRNAEARRRRIQGRVELVNSDIRDFKVPDDVTVVYAFNPFRGSIWEASMNALVESYDRAPRRIRLIYAKPLEHEVLSRMGRFKVESELGGTTIYCVV